MCKEQGWNVNEYRMYDYTNGFKSEIKAEKKFHEVYAYYTDTKKILLVENMGNSPKLKPLNLSKEEKKSTLGGLDSIRSNYSKIKSF